MSRAFGYLSNRLPRSNSYPDLPDGYGLLELGYAQICNRRLRFQYAGFHGASLNATVVYEHT